MFAVWLPSASAAPLKPIIVSTPNSTRAVAMDAIQFSPEPFVAKSTSLLYGADRSTRIMIFVLNLSLPSGENPSVVTAEAEDAAHRHFNLAVEYVGRTSGPDWLTAVVLRLDQDMGDTGDVLIQLTYQNVKSNRARIGVGHVGGGPADDPGAGPTPAPPYLLAGQIISAGVGLSGVTVMLGGASVAETTTDNNGRYSFTVASAGDYTLTPSKVFFTFNPASLVLANVAANRTVDFSAERTAFTIKGAVRDNQGKALGGIAVRLESSKGDPALGIMTDAAGNFSFNDLPRGYAYSVAPQFTNLFVFTPQTVTELNRDVILSFDASLQTYMIGGSVSDLAQRRESGVTVTLSGAATGSLTTDEFGHYRFHGLLAGKDYTISIQKKFFTVTPASIPVSNLLDNMLFVDFVAVRNTFVVDGIVKDNDGMGVDGHEVKLESPSPDAPARTLITSDGGKFSFSNVPAGFNYSITPQTTSLLAFTSQGITELNSNVSLAFNGTLRTYTISGFVGDQGTQSGLSGATVSLSGAATDSTITATDGSYSFNNLIPGRNYTVSAAKTYFTVTPASIALPNLSNNSALNNFTAVRNTVVINGIVKDSEGRELADALVKLESNSAEVPARTALTNGSGAFSFTDVLAGFNYTVTPQNTTLYAFTPQGFAALTSSLALTFNGTLRTYTISGTIKDQTQNGLAGVLVTLTGGTNRSATTDANGQYSFTNLSAGGIYTIAAAKTNYFIDPASSNLSLFQDELANFNATRFYIISGRVSDSAGSGLQAILMTLTGPQNASARTTSDGSYSFTVTASGNYVLTPSQEQDFYQFSPAVRSFSNLSDHQLANFSGAITITAPTYVLEFDGTPKNVDYGFFWPSDTNIGQFFWEVWAMPAAGAEATYMISDGYGGAHVLLFGFNSGPAGRYTLLGNIWVGTGVLYYNSDDGPSVGEWGHFAVGWDGQSIITYYDGVPVGKQPFTGPRVSTGTYNGSTMLFVGGSNHQNFKGRIAQIRGFEENNPHAGAPESAFTPQTVFSQGGELLSYYFRPNPVVTDLSNGYNGTPHFGGLRSMQDYFNGCPGCPIPEFVLDPTAPKFADAASPGTTTTLVGSPATPPDGARVFDSFSRNNSTYILNGKGGLGSTETGAAAWRTDVDQPGAQPFGILAGRAVVLANTMALAWVPVTSATGNLDIRVSRTNGAFGSGRHTGLCFRVVDKNNFFFAHSKDDSANPSGAKRLTIGYYQGGVRTILADNIVMPAAWTALRVVTRGSGAITVFADGVQVYAFSNSLNSTATGAGLFNHGAGMSLQNRWDSFAILDAP